MEQSGPINYVGGVNIPLKRVYFLNGDDTEKNRHVSRANRTIRPA